MSQSKLNDDDLFGEAATEMRDDVEDSLAAAKAELPDAETIWDVEADNTLGVLNALRSGLDVGEAEDHLYDAKKWYTMGQRAEAFDEEDDLSTEIEDLEETITQIQDARADVSNLASTIPELRGALEEAEAADADADADADESDDE
jgi:hypothetical protein